MKKIIDFTDKILETINFIKEKEGQRTFSATVHSIVSSYYNQKYYSKYNQVGVKIKEFKGVKAEIQPGLTKEQLCEQIVGGKIIKMPDGSLKCEYKDGAFLTKVPLTMVGTKECDPQEINERNARMKNPK
jgi:hypothetical protein